jgi:hypothetical protein
MNEVRVIALLAVSMIFASPIRAQDKPQQGTSDWPTRPLHFIVSRRGLDRCRRAGHCQPSHALARSADRGGEQIGRQWQHWHRGCCQGYTRRLHDSGCNRFRQQQPARLQDEHRSLAGIGADHPALPPTDRSSGASVSGGCLACGTDCARQTATRTALCDRWRLRDAPAYGGAMVRIHRRAQARAGAVSGWRASDQRSAAARHTEAR